MTDGDGALVDDGTTQYTQDLASPLSRVLQSTQISAPNYLYDLDRLASVAGSTRTWYGTDAPGSVRQTLSDSGVPFAVVNYDSWGLWRVGQCRRWGLPASCRMRRVGESAGAV